MTSFYNRVYEILIDDEPFVELTTERQFRCVFDIIIDAGGYMTYADIGVYNLSDTTAAKAFKKGNVISFRAGYVDTIDFLFKGRVKNTFKRRNGPDRITQIIARGGSQPETSIERTLGVNVKITTIIRACASALGYPVVLREEDFSDVPPYPRGYTLHGDPRLYLDRLAQTHDFSYVIDNERVVVTRNNSYRRGTPIVISQFTGMEGIPEITEIGCDVTTRLNPKLKIFGQIDIQSELSTFNFSNLYFQNIPPNAGSGIYRVFKIRHGGDTHGDEWSSEITSFR